MDEKEKQAVLDLVMDIRKTRNNIKTLMEWYRKQNMIPPSIKSEVMNNFRENYTLPDKPKLADLTAEAKEIRAYKKMLEAGLKNPQKVGVGMPRIKSGRY